MSMQIASDALFRRDGSALVGGAIRMAENAQSRGDWSDALRHWTHVRDQAPELDSGIIGIASALRELGRYQDSDSVLAGAISRFPSSLGIAIAYAMNAHCQRNWPEALRRWMNVRVRFPDHPYAYAATASVMLEHGRLEEAEALLADAIGVFPSDAGVAVHFASIAMARRDYRAAIQRWTNVERRFCDDPVIHAQALQALASIQAEHSIAEDDPTVREARAAEGRGDWQDAARLWTVARERAPASRLSLLGLGRALREAGNVDEADAILSEAVRAFPDDPEVAANYALVATKRQDRPEAARRWRRILTRFPNVIDLMGLAAAALREAGQFSECDALLRRGIELSPDRRDLRIHFALNAEASEDWREAALRWDAAHRLWPDDEDIRNCRGAALWHADLSTATEDDSSVPSPQPDEMAEKVSSDDLRNLVVGFEGLGDDCEFGLLQRRSGAEPIGLFRFATVGGPRNLIDLLDCGFEALGDAEFTYLDRLDCGEYLIKDRRGYYWMHSFIRADTVDADAFLRQQVRRINYLKQKLIEDLTAAEKIFVYKSTRKRLTDADLLSLHRAMRRYGNSALLGIRLQDEKHPAGVIEVLADDLMVGYLDRMVHAEVAKGFSPDVWLTLLRQARAVVAKAKKPVAAEAR